MSMSKAARGHLNNYQHPDTFGEWLGYKVDKVDRKKFSATVNLKLRDDHLSPAGRVHGGVVSAFFDSACGVAVFSTMNPNDYASTVELKVNYFKPLQSGDDLVCRAQVVHQGKRLCVVHAYLYRKREKSPVAMATATFNVIRNSESKSKRKS